MSKTVKGLIENDYRARFGEASDVLLINIQGINAEGTTRLRRELAKRDIKVTVVRNSLAKRLIAGTALEPLGRLMVGPTAMTYGEPSVVEIARELVRLAGEIQQIEIKGALLDGTVFEGKRGVEELSRFPTRDEAIAQSVTLILSPGRNLLAQVKGPGGRLAGIIKTIESKLEKGETIG